GRLNWDGAGDGIGYAVILNDRNLGTVRSTSVRIIRMRADTDYRIRIDAVDAAGKPGPYTVTVTVHTKAVTPMATGSWLTLSNALSGRVADLFGARSADGTPLVLYRSQGAANQQWRLEPAGTAGVLIRSKA